MIRCGRFVWNWVLLQVGRLRGWWERLFKQRGETSRRVAELEEQVAALADQNRRLLTDRHSLRALSALSERSLLDSEVTHQIEEALQNPDTPWLRAPQLASLSQPATRIGRELANSIQKRIERA